MREHSSATVVRAPVVPAAPSAGLWWGLLGVAAFSFTVPFTRVAVGGLSPLFIGSGRAVVAAVLAAVALALTRQRLPRGGSGRGWRWSAAGVVVGFPLLTSYALTTTPGQPRRRGHRPAAGRDGDDGGRCAGTSGRRCAFWVVAGRRRARRGRLRLRCSAAGSGSCTGPTCCCSAPCVAAAVGYAEGGLLARELGAWQTVSWALVLCAPLMVRADRGLRRPRQPPSATPAQWAAFAYLGVVSMFLGFFAWYRGLAIGPMAQVSQVQLVQPVLSIALGRPAAGRAHHGGHRPGRPGRHRLRRRRGPGPAGAPRRGRDAASRSGPRLI